MHLWLIIPYSVAVLSFVFISLYLVSTGCARHGIASPHDVFQIITWTTVFGFIGARLGYVLIEYQVYLHAPLQTLMLWKGGYSSMGAVIAGGSIGLILLKKKNISILRFGDIVSPYIALSIFFARVGGFIRGSSFGKITNLPWGVIYPRDSLAFKAQLSQGIISANAPYALPVHPTTLYEATGAIIAFIVVIYIGHRKHKDGVVMWTLLLVYSIERFVIDYFRGDMSPVVFNILTPSQIISGLIAVASVYALMRVRHL
jgi:phosphatidylglycerol:prolipoprotein diacylglycerol transferase